MVFSYYLGLAWRSLRRAPLITALMVLLIGAGVAASMTSIAALRAVSADPLPQRSVQLFTPQLDNFGPASRRTDGEPPAWLSYQDAMALLSAHRAEREAALYGVARQLVPADPARAPFHVAGYAVSPATFAMFDIPFLYGAAWGDASDRMAAPVVAISRSLNQRLFGGVDSVGRSIRLNDRDYRVVGVTADWNPQPRFYAGEAMHIVADVGQAPDIFLPFGTAIQQRLVPNWGSYCVPLDKGGDFADLLHAECDWITFWVQLPDAQAAARYRQFLASYALQQQRRGRFHWKPATRLRGLMAWLAFAKAVPPETRQGVLLALALLVVCLVNTVALLLARFMRRGGETGVRRALGAPRQALYAQFLVEAGLIGLLGGVLGAVLTGLGVSAMSLFFAPRVARLVHVDLALLGLSLLLAMLATLLAALYPSWRAARIPAALQLKVQ